MNSNCCNSNCSSDCTSNSTYNKLSNNTSNQINNSHAVLLDNEYFIFYLEGTNVHLNSKPKEIQEQYDSESVMSHKVKMQKMHQVLDYFYNFWKMIESSNDTKMYTIYFNINLIMIDIPISFYGKIKSTLDSLKSVIQSNVIESYFKVENKLAKYFLDIILTMYKPVKPIHII